MKKRLLALLLVVVMLVSVAPAALALELPDVSKVDTSKVQVAIKNLSDYVNGELDYGDGPSYDACHGEYKVTSDSYYVSLGDSSVTGINAANGVNPEGYNNYGYKTVVKECFPYKLAEKLELDVETQYIQLALAAMRTVDLRYVLDESFVPDAYTMSFMTNRFNMHTGGIEKMRADYKAALAKADLVTLSIGNNDIGFYVNEQIQGLMAELLKSNDTLMSLLNGPVGAQVKPMLSEHVNIDAPIYEMDWDSYLDAEGMKYVEAVLTEVKTALAEAGAPEIYTFELGEIIQPMLDEQFGAGLIKVSIPLDIPVHQLAADIIEVYLYGYITRAFNYAEVVDKIHELSEAHVVILGMYNPMDDAVVAYDGMEIPFGEYLDYAVNMLNLNCIKYATQNSDDTTYVSINDAESNLDSYFSKYGGTYELMEYLTTFTSADNHATDAGHSYIADQIYNALTITMDNEPIVNPFKDVAEKDYFYAPVMWAVENGITSGLTADTFGPAKGCTRAQVVTFLWRAAGEPAPKSSANPFTDVKQGQYYYDAVLWAVENGITTGLSATSFGPNENCNRGQIVTFLWRAMGKPAPTNSTNPFKDVSAKQYYYDAVLWAVEEGITTGLSATSFGPNSTCTRGQIVTFLYRAYK